MYFSLEQIVSGYNRKMYKYNVSYDNATLTFT
jgi:hypothetical protein